MAINATQLGSEIFLSRLNLHKFIVLFIKNNIKTQFYRFHTYNSLIEIEFICFKFHENILNHVCVVFVAVTYAACRKS